jgi:hypothetical protein
MGDPFRVDVPSHVLSAGRSDLRLLRGDAFSVVITMTGYPQVVPTYGYWEATLSASILPWPVIRRSFRPTAIERWRFQRRYYNDLLSAGRSDLRLLRGDAFSVVQSYKEIKINKIRGSNYGQFFASKATKGRAKEIRFQKKRFFLETNFTNWP